MQLHAVWVALHWSRDVAARPSCVRPCVSLLGVYATRIILNVLTVCTGILPSCQVWSMLQEFMCSIVPFPSRKIREAGFKASRGLCKAYRCKVYFVGHSLSSNCSGQGGPVLSTSPYSSLAGNYFDSLWLCRVRPSSSTSASGSPSLNAEP